MKIGLFFGSFNPIHTGHIAIAKYMAGHTGLDKVWLVVSPHNPLKDKRSLEEAKKRLALVKRSVGRNSKIKVSDVEFSLPQPSYTIKTLTYLKNKYPKHEFVLIIGSDNLNLFHKWKDYRKILKGYEIYVYPRSSPPSKGGLSLPAGQAGGILSHHNVKLFDAPLLDISSTFIREQIKKGKKVNHLLA
jgi:nicotinate-nucleotide adenylyltransferase